MINKFNGEHSFLSNFYIDSNGWSVEVSYQASKFPDVKIRKQVMDMTPYQAKKFAHLPENQDKILPDWYKISLKQMEKFVRIKFSKDPEKSMLLKTGKLELIEGNYWHDNFYGSCGCDSCKDKKKHNHLGKILMKVRLVLNNEIF